MIRAGKEQDLAAIMKIWLDANLGVHSFIPGEYWTDNEAAVRAALPQAEVYVYEDENTGRTDGFIGLTHDYIEGIFVREAVRGRGIGKQLLDYVKKIRSVLHLRVYQKNRRAVSFYQRERFLIQSEGQDEATGETEFLMVWSRQTSSSPEEKCSGINQKFIREIEENTRFQETEKAETEYRFQEPEYRILEERYHLSKNVGRTDLETALNMLAWVNGHIHHRGDYDGPERQDALTLLKAAFDQDYGIHCLAMSIVLCECLLALHMKARVMYMMPREVEDGDNHVVVEVFLSEEGKWIMLDPTYGSYCTDFSGEILNLREIRNHIAQNREYKFAGSMCYNGVKVEDIDDMKNYYAKNLFFLRCKRIQGYGQHREFGNMLEIAPIGFDVHKRMVDNLRFRIKSYGPFEPFHIWMNYEENLRNVYINIEDIY